MNFVKLDKHLNDLENESIYIIREAFAEGQNTTMLYSMGKDSSVMLHLAKKAFFPTEPSFTLLHIDTRFKFKDMYDFRKKISEEYDLLTYINAEVIEKNINPFDFSSAVYTDIAKTQALKKAIDHFKFDMILCGARRDEEKSRSKEKIFSFRSSAHLWDSKNQRAEFLNLFNTKKNKNESFRVFPLSNWTELDIWRYIKQEKIEVNPLYFAKIRPVVTRDEKLIMVDDERLVLNENEKIQNLKIRFRTLGCYPLTAAILSNAETVDEIIEEIVSSEFSERQGRLIDLDTLNSMEKKKSEGYF